mmetsp:Transcript_28805/g.65248  ORF Transcript_28805/g.65248 Transcript_28805/m.65248 type:complete len:99 (+) Transcript_28805:186-482(+)
MSPDPVTIAERPPSFMIPAAPPPLHVEHAMVSRINKSTRIGHSNAPNCLNSVCTIEHNDLMLIKVLVAANRTAQSGLRWALLAKSDDHVAVGNLPIIL